MMLHEKCPSAGHEPLGISLTSIQQCKHSKQELKKSLNSTNLELGKCDMVKKSGFDVAD